MTTRPANTFVRGYDSAEGPWEQETCGACGAVVFDAVDVEHELQYLEDPSYWELVFEQHRSTTRFETGVSLPVEYSERDLPF